MQLTTTTCVLVTLKFVHTATDDYVKSADPDDPVLQSRRECRDYYEGVKYEHLPADIISHRGFGDFLDQPFGLKLPVCSLREGYTSKMLAEPIEFAKYVPEYLVRLVPALTRGGFKKS